MNSTRRTHKELAEWHAAQAEKYRRLVLVRDNKTLAELSRTVKLLRKVAPNAGAHGEACLAIATTLEDLVRESARSEATPALPFENDDPDFEVKS